MTEERLQTTVGTLVGHYGGSVKTGPFGTALKAHEYTRDGVPVISVGEIGYGTLNVHVSTPRVPPAVVQRLPEYTLEVGDIVFGRKGAVDRSAMVQADQVGWFLGSDGIRLRLPSTCDARFIAYQLRSAATRAWLLQNATGTTIASLNQSTVARIPILLAPLSEQRAIGHVLSTLDEKIKLNQTNNGILDSLALSLLLTASSRWPCHTLSTVTTMLSGGTPSKGADDLWSGTIPWVSPKDMDRWLIDDAEDHVADEAIGNGTRLAPTGAVLIVVRSMTLAKRVQLGLTMKPVAFNQDLKAIVPAPGIPGSVLLYGLATLRPQLLAAVDEASHGTKRLRSEILDNLQVPIPPSGSDETVATLSKIVDLMAANLRQNRTLAELRDLLLPRLVSGEIRIKDAEEVVQSVV